MFGIDDPYVYIAYLVAFGCLVFAFGYGIIKWNESDEEDGTNTKKPQK